LYPKWQHFKPQEQLNLYAFVGYNHKNIFVYAWRQAWAWHYAVVVAPCYKAVFGFKTALWRAAATMQLIAQVYAVVVFAGQNGACFYIYIAAVAHAWDYMPAHAIARAVVNANAKAELVLAAWQSYAKAAIFTAWYKRFVVTAYCHA